MPAHDQKPRPEVALAPGQLRIIALPWADVFIDGEKVGTTPSLRMASLRPGKHRVRFDNPKFPSVEKVVEIRPGKESELQVRLNQ